MTSDRLNTLLTAASITFEVKKENIFQQTRRYNIVICRQTIMKYLFEIPGFKFRRNIGWVICIF